MAMASVRSNRFDWVDWMKAVGIYLVVLGHFYSVGEKLIYVFHVPLFFLISGFLTRKESDNRLFWRKLWYNLAVPMLIMATLNAVFDFGQSLLNGTFVPMDIYWFVRNVMFGMVAGFDALWFVYTLIILKIIFQYAFSDKVFYAVAITMLALACMYNHVDLSVFPFFLKEPNAIVNACAAFPFFALGVLARGYKELLNGWDKKKIFAILFICGFLLVGGCYYYNDYVAMYRCYYGDSVILFLVGGIAGSIMIFAVSKLFGRAPSLIGIISRGTIVILGFHKLFIAMIREVCSESSCDVLFAALIVVLFVPLIILTEKYFPLMSGKYRTINADNNSHYVDRNKYKTSSKEF